MKCHEGDRSTTARERQVDASDELLGSLLIPFRLSAKSAGLGLCIYLVS
jgi:hypothetical protein